jgi:hypothetical protein
VFDALNFDTEEKGILLPAGLCARQLLSTCPDGYDERARGRVAVALLASGWVLSSEAGPGAISAAGGLFLFGGVTKQILVRGIGFQYTSGVGVDQEDTLGGLLYHRSVAFFALS